ncbi:glycosyltransferase family 4 protein [Megalodesulfovibrio paquesii]
MDSSPAIRIAHFSFSGDFGGREQVAMQLTRSMVHAGVPCVLILGIEERAGTTRNANLLQAIEKSNIPVKLYATSSRFSLLLARQISKHISESRIGILHCHCYKSLGYALFMRKLGLFSGIITFTLHGLLLPTHFKSNVIINFQRYAIRHIDGVIGCSKEVLSSSCKDLPATQPQTSIINAIKSRDATYEEIRSNSEGCKQRLAAQFDFTPDHTVIINVGRLSHQKNFILYLQMIHALMRQSTHHPPCIFLIVGSGELESQLLFEAHQLGIAEHIRFTGFYADMQSIYQAADLLVQTSIWEGTPMCLLEAMECGLPVVAPHVGGNPDVVAHNETGMLYPINQLQTLTQYTTEYLYSAALREQHGCAGHAHVRNTFNTQRWVEQHMQFYSRLHSDCMRRTTV